MMKRNVILLLITAISLTVGCAKKDPYLREDIQSQAWNHLEVGVSEYSSLNFSNARLFLEKALEEAKSIDNVELQIKALLSLGELELILRSHTKSSNYIFKAWALSEFMESDDMLFSLNSTTGKYYSKMMDYETAIEYYNAAYQSTSDKKDKAIIYNNLGVIHRTLKNYSEAYDYFNKAVRINKKKKIYGSLGGNYYNLGELYYIQNDSDNALKNYFLALENDKKSEDSLDILTDLKKIGIVYSDKNELDKALYYFIRALNLAVSIDNEEEIAVLTKLIKDIDPQVLIDWGFVIDDEDEEETVTVTETEPEDVEESDDETVPEGDVKVKVEEVKGK